MGLVISLFAFILFSHIESFPLRKWDEARNSINALEMYNTGVSLVTTCQYRPDHWNTKPPLLAWCQMISFKIFGVREFSVRLISVISGMLFIPLFLLLRRKLSLNVYHILLALSIFISFPLLVKSHCFKTGDYDALLCFCMTAYSLFYFSFLKHKQSSHLYLFFIFLFLASMTKGIAGLLFLPGLFLYTLFSRKLLSTLSNKKVIFSSFLFLLFTLGYYVVRNIIDPGYIQSIFQNELGGRFLETNENHSAVWHFYISNLFLKDISYWALFLLIIPVYFFRNKNVHPLATFIAFLIPSHLLVISVSQTKLYWYSLPIYPLLAILLGIVLYEIFKRSDYLKALPLLCILPIYNQIETVSRNTNFQDNPADYFNIDYLKNNEAYLLNFENINILEPDYIEHTRFYTERLHLIKPKLFYFQQIQHLELNDIVLVSSHQLKDELNNKYELELIHSEDPSYLFKVIRKK